MIYNTITGYYSTYTQTSIIIIQFVWDQDTDGYILSQFQTC